MPKVLGGGFIVMSHALDNAGHNCNLLDAGRVARDDQGARDRPLRRRCAGRSAAAARAARSSSSRWPTPTRASTRASRRSAPSPTRGRRRCSTRTTTSACSTSRTRRAGSRACVYDPVAISGVLRPPEHRATRSRSRRRSRTRGDPIAVVPGRAGRQGLRPDRRTRTACGARCRTTWSTCSAATSDGFARRGFDNVGIQYGLKGLRDGAHLARAVRRPQHPHRRRRHRPQHRPRAHRGRPDRARARSTAPARSTRPTTSTRSRSSTCAGRTRAPSTTSTAPTRCAPGC